MFRSYLFCVMNNIILSRLVGERYKKVVLTCDYEEEHTQMSHMERRRKKFSSGNRGGLNPREDIGLLSRSSGASSASLEALQGSQIQRVQFLRQLKQENDPELLGYGLRRLREIIVSVFHTNRHNTDFISFLGEVYSLSYQVFLSQAEYVKCGNIVLSFLVEHVPQWAARHGYLAAYIIYLSHFERDLSKAISEYYRYKYIVTSTKDYLANDLVKLSVLYNEQSGLPKEWFQIVNSEKFTSRYPLAYDLLRSSGKICEVQLRCISTCTISYNQIPLEFLETGYLCGYPLEDEVLKEIHAKYSVEKRGEGREIIMFRRRKA